MLVQTLPALRALVDACLDAKVIGLDAETRPRDGIAYSGLDVRAWDGVYEHTRSRVAGVSLTHDPEQGFYVPLQHDRGNIDASPAEVIAEFRRLGAALSGKQLLAAMWNSGFDAAVLGKLLGLRALPLGSWIDGQIIDQFARPWSYTHDLKSTVKRVLKIEMKHFDAPMREVWVPELDLDHPLHIARRNTAMDFGAYTPEEADQYASEDGRCTLAYVLAMLDVKLPENTQRLVALEHEFVAVVMALHRGQIGYDRTAAIELADELLAERAFLADLLHADGLANPDSPKQTLAWLRRYGFFGESADKDALRAFRGDDRFRTARAALTAHRKASKYISTYLSPLLNADHPSEVMGSFKQWGARSGRMSAGPAKNKKKKDDVHCWSSWAPHGQPRAGRMRALYVARSGYMLGTLDYSSQEYRCAAQLSSCKAWIATFNGPDPDVHTANARILYPSFEREPAAVQKRMRDTAKVFGFASIYGATPERIALMLDISVDEASRLMAALMDGAPELRAFIQASQAEAQRYGRVFTAFGRPISVRPKDTTDDDLRVHASTNYRVQGTCADLLRFALTEFFRREAGSVWMMGGDDSVRIVNAIHDEIVVEAHEHKIESVVATLRCCMEGAVPSDWSVRIPVEGKIARCWQK